ncbi:unnamed protein product [Cladocopium goreaui]|uniref:Uncharacterized protein n=1 Tax=Cladocopium goreaui TaxID=2562237 RepID=A0A9P1DCL9_9DINO|nr:unnamed protein product [Cladocopium goreaui]
MQLALMTQCNMKRMKVAYTHPTFEGYNGDNSRMNDGMQNPGLHGPAGPVHFAPSDPSDPSASYPHQVGHSPRDFSSSAMRDGMQNAAMHGQNRFGAGSPPYSQQPNFQEQAPLGEPKPRQLQVMEEPGSLDAWEAASFESEISSLEVQRISKEASPDPNEAYYERAC